MIGKISIGKSFKECIAYCLHDKIQQQNQESIMKDRAEVLLFNKCYGNEQELVQQFNEVRRLNLKVSKPVLHITLSLAPGEQLSKHKLMEMCEYCARELGFENNQYIAISHRDTSHQHLHIVANRIGFDGRTVSDSNSYGRIATYCRKMEQKYELKQVLSPKRYLSKQQRNLPRHDQRKELLRQHIREALKDCSHFEQFEQRIKQRGYRIIKGRGISFTDEKKVTVKGSELNYSLQTIERIIERQSLFPGKQLIQTWNKQYSQVAKENLPEHSLPIPGQYHNNSDLLHQLLKPEEQSQQMQSSFENQKKKKRQSHHL